GIYSAKGCSVRTGFRDIQVRQGGRILVSENGVAQNQILGKLLRPCPPYDKLWVSCNKLLTGKNLRGLAIMPRNGVLLVGGTS
ncbi:MAG TPA: hypothetical protein DHW22_07230, partial [Planctomycetaceae bacterium]|nr:hypothetical protein [Planctomycetaceae bacterium]